MNPPSTQSGRTTWLAFLTPVLVSVGVMLVMTLVVLAGDPDPVRRRRVTGQEDLFDASVGSRPLVSDDQAGTTSRTFGSGARRRGFSPVRGGMVLRGGEQSAEGDVGEEERGMARNAAGEAELRDPAQLEATREELKKAKTPAERNRLRKLLREAVEKAPFLGDFPGMDRVLNSPMEDEGVDAGQAVGAGGAGAE